MDSPKIHDPGDTSENLFLSWLDVIERVTAFVCARQHVSSADADDFGAHVKLKLFENDCTILRKFRGHSTPRTFLSVVVQRLFQDYRISQWGKWRPCAQANRLGPTAVLLERLVMRDGHSFDEACEILRTNHHVADAPSDLERLFAQFPRRVKRRFLDDQVLVDLPAPNRPADEILLDHEREAAVERCRSAVRRAVAQLGEQDRLILAFRFRDGRTVREIAEILRLDHKSLFRRIDRLLRQLRELLEQDGIKGLDASDPPFDRGREQVGGGPDEGRLGSGASEDAPRPRGPGHQRPSGTAAEAPQAADIDTQAIAAVLTDWSDSEEEKRWPVRLGS